MAGGTAGNLIAPSFILARAHGIRRENLARYPAGDFFAASFRTTAYALPRRVVAAWSASAPRSRRLERLRAA
nr:unnamed protein product [Digitaria exilis]